MRLTDEVAPLTPARLQAVLAVAATGSFSDAARQLGTSQSSVSRSVAVVESVVGTPIFDRSTRSVRLTDAGREFVERAGVINAELEAAVHAIRQVPPVQPRVVLATLASVSELHLAAAVSSTGAQLARFRCIEGLQADVVHAVSSGAATVGISDLAAAPDDLLARPLWSEPFRLAAPQTEFSGRASVTLADAAARPLVSFSRDAELRTTIDRELAAARSLRSPDYVVDRYATALSMVAAGLGVMVVPAIVGPAVPDGVRLLDLDHPDLNRTMGLLQRPDTSLPPVGETLVAHLAAGVGSTPGVTVTGT